MKENIIIGAIVAAVLYLIVASATFSLRHPWATETERFLHTWDVLTFQKVPYNEMRPR